MSRNNITALAIAGVLAIGGICFFTLNEEHLVKSKAESWFMENVVKDPQSTKIESVTAVKYTERDALNDFIENAKQEMADKDIDPTDDFSSIIAQNETLAHKCDSSAHELSNSGNFMLRMKAMELEELGKKASNSAEECRELQQLVDSYNDAKKQLEANKPELDNFKYWQVHIECKTKNGYGQSVLGKCEFPFTKDGAYINDSTTFAHLKILQ